MMKLLFAASLACASLAACTNAAQPARESAPCTDKDSLEIVMNLHRKVKPEFVSAYKAAFAKCKAETLKEEGCLDYGVYQSPEDSTEFLIYENWANEAALAKHGQSAHLKQLGEETKGMFDAQRNKKVYVLPEK